MQKIFIIENKYSCSQALREINTTLSAYPNAKVAHITPFSESVSGNGAKGDYGAFIVIEYDDIERKKVNYERI